MKSVLKIIDGVKITHKHCCLLILLCLCAVPCVPTDVEVMVDCSTNEAVVSWSASDGALSYKARARSTQGDASACDTTGLTCTLTNLTCGQSYFVQVVAQDDVCSSLPSPATEFSSGRITQVTGFNLEVTMFTSPRVTDFTPPSLSQFPARPPLAQWSWTATPTRPSWTGTTPKVLWTTTQRLARLTATFPPATPTTPTVS